MTFSLTLRFHFSEYDQATTTYFTSPVAACTLTNYEVAYNAHVLVKQGKYTF